MFNSPTFDDTVLIVKNVMATIITPANVIEIKNIDFKYYNLYARKVLFNAKVIKACSSQPSRHSVK